MSQSMSVLSMFKHLVLIIPSQVKFQYRNVIGNHQRVVFTTPLPPDHQKVKSPQFGFVEVSKHCGGSCAGLNFLAA
jgi:hypothetical protein